MMHSSMFINGILFSLKALVNITEKHVDQLMACEKDMLCQIFKCQRSVPLEALYIESNVTPIKFISCSPGLWPGAQLYIWGMSLTEHLTEHLTY